MVHVATIVNVHVPPIGEDQRAAQIAGGRQKLSLAVGIRCEVDPDGLVVKETHRGMQFHSGWAHRREPSGKRVLQGVHDRERTPVLQQDVVEASQRMAGQGRQHAEHEVIQQQVEEVPRERGKGVLRELVVTGLVAHRSVREGIEHPQDVGKRLRAVARQAGQEGDGHPVGRDLPQPVRKPGRAAQSGDRARPQNLGEPVSKLGTLSCVHRGPPLREWCAQHPF